MLDPTLPAQGVDKIAHYSRKFGPNGVGWITDPNSYLNQRGRSVGIEMKYNQGSKVFNSFGAHRLLHYARARGTPTLQNGLAEILFRKYLNEGVNLGLEEELVAAAKEGGVMTEAEAASFLRGTEYTEEVKKEIEESHTKVSGVPHFIFPSGAETSGGQEVNFFKQMLQKEASKMK